MAQSCSALHPCVTTKACQRAAGRVDGGDALLALIRWQQTLLVIQGYGLPRHQSLRCVDSISPADLPHCPGMANEPRRGGGAVVAARSCHQLTVELTLGLTLQQRNAFSCRYPITSSRRSGCLSESWLSGTFRCSGSPGQLALSASGFTQQSFAPKVESRGAIRIGADPHSQGECPTIRPWMMEPPSDSPTATA